MFFLQRSLCSHKYWYSSANWVFMHNIIFDSTLYYICMLIITFLFVFCFFSMCLNNMYNINVYMPIFANKAYYDYTCCRRQRNFMCGPFKLPNGPLSGLAPPESLGWLRHWLHTKLPTRIILFIWNRWKSKPDMVCRIQKVIGAY